MSYEKDLKEIEDAYYLWILSKEEYDILLWRIDTIAKITV